jgi:hypothetical protein
MKYYVWRWCVFNSCPCIGHSEILTIEIVEPRSVWLRSRTYWTKVDVFCNWWAIC